MNNSLLLYRRYYILLQTTVISILFMLVYLLNMKNSIGIFYFLCIWNILIYAWAFYNELTNSSCFHPFIIFTLISLQYCGFSPIGSLKMMQSGETIYLGSTKINDALTLGYLYLTLEHYLIMLGYFLYDNRKIRQNDDYRDMTTYISHSNKNYYKIALYNYLFVIILRFIDGIIFSLSSISSVIETYSTTGYLVSLALLSYAKILTPNRSINLLYWLITAIEIFFVLGKGMKQAIITPLLPYIIYLLVAYKDDRIRLNSFSFISKAAIIIIFIIGFAFPYITTFRNIANREHKKWNEIPVSQALSEYVENIVGSSDKNNQSGLETFMNRAGSIGSNSFSIDYAEKHGYSSKYFIATTSALIPRIIWPNKPRAIRGSMAYYLALGYSYDDAYQKANSTKNVTSITLGFVGSSYLVLGLGGALLFPFIAGLFSAYIWHFVRTRQNDVVAIWLFYSLMTTIFIDYESFIDFGLVFYAWSIVYILIIKFNERFKIYG